MIDKIIDIICKTCRNDEVRKNRNVDLLESDIIDSMGFIYMISALEKEFKIEIQPTEVPSDVWRSTDKIAEMIEDKIREKESKI